MQDSFFTTLKISFFAALSDPEEVPYPQTNIWSRVICQKDRLGGYLNEASVNFQVHNVIIYCCHPSVAEEEN